MAARMGAPEGFEYRERKSGEVHIFRDGSLVTTLRSRSADRFLRDVEASDPQEVMARVTGNYKRGNERR